MSHVALRTKAILFCSQTDLRRCGWRKINLVNLTQRREEARNENAERLIIVMDLSQLWDSHFICLFIKSEMHLHNIFLHLEGTLEEGTPPTPTPITDFQEFDILMNRCIFRGATIQSERHIINWIAAVKSKSSSVSTELSGTDSLCPQGCASFQLRENSPWY